MMEVISPAVLIINLCVAIFLNSIGIYFLRKVKNRRTYQNIILINMSSAQILMSLMTIPHWALTMNGYDMYSGVNLTLLEILKPFHFPLYMIMIFLTIDRFLACKLSLRFRIVLTERMCFVVLAMAWLSGLIDMLILLFSDDSMHQIDIQERLIFPILDGIFLCTALITYAFILSKIFGRRHSIERNTTATGRMGAATLKFFQVSATIIFTFIVFVVAPHSVQTIYLHTKGDVPMSVEFANYTVLSPYFIILPLLYIFMQKEVCILVFLSLSSRFKCTLCHQKENMNKEETGNNRVYDTRL